jgi:hypothetical protein
MTNHLRPTILALLAACGASATPATSTSATSTPATEPHTPQQSTRGDGADPRCSGRNTFCSLTGCGDGKTLCLTVMVDTKAVIKEVITTNRALFSRCYESYLDIDPKAEGTVRTVFIVDAHGAVPQASAVGIDSSVETCMVAALETLTFPELAGHPTTVRYPFTFHRAP